MTADVTLAALDRQTIYRLTSGQLTVGATGTLTVAAGVTLVGVPSAGFVTVRVNAQGTLELTGTSPAHSCRTCL